MNPAKQDFILEKHVFKMMEIETASACEVNCFLEADCVSYNLKPQQNGKLLCELSDSDHANNRQDLRYKEGTVYKSFKVSWPILISNSVKFSSIKLSCILNVCKEKIKSKMKEICEFFFIFLCCLVKKTIRSNFLFCRWKRGCMNAWIHECVNACMHSHMYEMMNVGMNLEIYL